MTIVVDTGPLYAAIDRRDPDHRLVLGAVSDLREPLLAPVTVLVETCLLLERRLGPFVEARFLRAQAAGDIGIEPLHEEDIGRAAALVERYAALRLGFVDASVVAAAERLNVSRLFTLDRRHFSVIRPRHCPAFELLP